MHWESLVFQQLSLGAPPFPHNMFRYKFNIKQYSTNNLNNYLNNELCEHDCECLYSSNACSSVYQENPLCPSLANCEFWDWFKIFYILVYSLEWFGACLHRWSAEACFILLCRINAEPKAKSVVLWALNKLSHMYGEGKLVDHHGRYRIRPLRTINNCARFCADIHPVDFWNILQQKWKVFPSDGVRRRQGLKFSPAEFAYTFSYPISTKFMMRFFILLSFSGVNHNSINTFSVSNDYLLHLSYFLWCASDGGRRGGVLSIRVSSFDEFAFFFKFPPQQTFVWPHHGPWETLSDCLPVANAHPHTQARRCKRTGARAHTHACLSDLSAAALYWEAFPLKWGGVVTGSDPEIESLKMK